MGRKNRAHVKEIQTSYKIPLKLSLLKGDGAPKSGFGAVEHSHNFSELSIIFSGSGVHRVEGNDYKVGAGDVFVVQRDQTHMYCERHSMKYAHVMFDAAALPLPEAQLKEIPGYHALFMLEPVMRRHSHFDARLHLDHAELESATIILEKMLAEEKHSKAGFEAMLVARLTELLVLLSRAYEKSDKKDERSLFRLAEVIGVLEKDFARAWSLDELAALAGLSRSRFIGVFSSATGFAPIDYLLRVRIKRAMQLLRNTALPVTTIAFEVGFNDSNYFTRQFKRISGMPPLVYRRSN